MRHEWGDLCRAAGAMQLRDNKRFFEPNVKTNAKLKLPLQRRIVLRRCQTSQPIYYAETLPNVHNPPPRYNADENETNLSLFRGQLGSASGATPKTLQHEEWRTIMMYVLTNLSEIEPYIE